MKLRHFTLLIVVAFARMLAAEPCDVMVVGGGPAGIAAALQAGRSGASVVLVERGFQVGGNMTTGGVNFPGLFHAWGRQVIDGCAYEVLTNAVFLSGEALPDFRRTPKQHWLHQLHVDIPVFVALAEEALCKAGVRIRYHTVPMSVRRSGDVWKVTVAADGVPEDLYATVLVDCTGDGTLAAMAGARRMRDAETSPGSFLYSFANGRELWDRCDKKTLESAYRKALESGELKAYDAKFGLAGIVPSVPLRALCAKGVKNLLVAGRCMSGDRLAMSGLRVQATCMATGQVAGEAASLAARLKCDARTVPLLELRTRLAASGAVVPEFGGPL